MRSIVLFILLLVSGARLSAQSISLIQASPEIYCSNGVDSFRVSWNSIPAGSNIVFYQSTDSAFNPYLGQGDSIGFIHITSTSTNPSEIKTICPEIIGIFIDACNAPPHLEQANEYMVITSGNSGFLPSSLMVNLPANKDINNGAGTCSFQTPSNTLMNLLWAGSCNPSNLIPAGPSDFIPADALVVIFTGNGTDYPYNFSSFCSTGQKVYILQNACTQPNGSFLNSQPATGCPNNYRTTIISTGSCSSELTYAPCTLPPFDPLNPNAGDGNYVIRLPNTDTSSVTNGGILNNAADKCNGVVIDTTGGAQTIIYPIPNDGSANPNTNFCNTGYHYIKAITHPNGTQPVSNTIRFQLVCPTISISGSNTFCSGGSVSLSAVGQFDSLRWSNNATTASINVSTTGNYSVTGYKSGCSANAAISVSQKSCSSDTLYICKGDSVKLTGPTGYQHYSWTPNAGLNNDTIVSPNASPLSTTTYIVTASSSGATDTTEHVMNGAFENGITNWYTDMFFAPGGSPSNGWYLNTTTTWCNTPDHTSSGDSLFLSSPSADTTKVLLSQTISVQPNTSYDFSFWIMNFGSNAPVFKIVINGIVVASNITPSQTCQWVNSTTVWNSQNNTSAVIQLFDIQPQISGNDFGLDDISLKEHNSPSQIKDTIVVVVRSNITPINLGNDTSYCGTFSRTLSTGNGNTVWSTGVTASQITVTQPGKYWATISGSCGTASDTITISQSQGLIFSFGGNTSVCRNSTVTLDAGTGYTAYLWSTGETTQKIIVSNPGKYWAQVSKNGCQGSDTIFVSQIDKAAPFYLGRDTAYCGNFSQTLSSGNPQTSWTRNGTQFATNAASVTVSQGGTYIASVANSCGTVADTLVISTSNSIPLNLGNDTAICSGQSITLDATVPGNNQYLWNTGAQTSSISVNQFGRYWVQVSNGICTVRDSVLVDTAGPPNPIDLGADTSFCGPFSIQLFTGDNTIWSTGVTGTGITVTQAGTYIAENRNQCGSQKDTIVFTQNPLPPVSLGKDSIICDSMVLTVNGNYNSILWSTNDTTNFIVVYSTGMYYVTVTDSLCPNSDTVFIKKECQYEVYLPSAFTPNGDGINDILVPMSNIKGIVVLSFSVYNRWGEKVFEATNFIPGDLSNGWNGTFRGEHCQQDSYGYYYSVKLPDDQVKTYKGTVTLMR